MEVKIICPHCSAEATVPSGASGLAVQCTSCHKEFSVPALEEVDEETISSWIADDVEEVLTERHTTSEQQALEAEEAARQRRRRRRERRERRRQRSKRSSRSSQPWGTVPAEPKPETKPTTPPRDAAPPPVKRPELDATSPVPKPPDTAESPKPRIPTPHLDDAARRVVEFPTELHVNGPIPHLVVNRCTQMGVQFSFDAQWLGHRGFQMSMPRRCVCSGADDGDLLARPLAFVDRSQTAYRSSSELEQLYEQQVGRRTAAVLIDAMGLIERLPKPFDNPVPYYVAANHAAESLECTTQGRDDGEITCQIVIPNHACALHWLERVNGVCGAEYELLKGEIAHLHTDSWDQLPHETRQRISAWCEFAPGETLRLYLSDADFRSRDAGLAGLVLTDRRLVFHKYHHGGSVQIRSEATLYAKRQDKFSIVSIEHDQRISRVAKLSSRDFEQLAEAIRPIKNWEIRVVEG